jgi:hypothetical protein
MQGETKKRWEELCSLAEVEQDPEKFLNLHREIVLLLESKENRLQPRPEKELSISRESMKRVKELAAKIAVEQNPEKFRELVRELNNAAEDLGPSGAKPPGN